MHTTRHANSKQTSSVDGTAPAAAAASDDDDAADVDGNSMQEKAVSQ